MGNKGGKMRRYDDDFRCEHEETEYAVFGMRRKRVNMGVGGLARHQFVEMEFQCRACGKCGFYTFELCGDGGRMRDVHYYEAYDTLFDTGNWKGFPRRTLTIQDARRVYEETLRPYRLLSNNCADWARSLQNEVLERYG